MVDQRFTAPLAVHLFLFADDRVLLLHPCNTGYADGLWGVPAGHLDGGESVAQAAVREAREEIGVALRVEDVRVASVIHAHQEMEYVYFFVSVEHWQGTPHNAEPDKCDAVRWLPLQALPAEMVPYIRQGLSNVRSGTFFDSIGFP